MRERLTWLPDDPWSIDPVPILTIALDSARSYTILGDSGEIPGIHSPRLPNALDKEPEVFHSETVLRKLESGASLLEAHMTADRISELVAAGESETLEFKSTTGQRSDAAKSL